MVDNLADIPNNIEKVGLIFDSLSTSIHESSHVIYGLLKGFIIESVSIYEDKEAKRVLGMTYYNNPELETIHDPDLFLYMAEHEICLKYAGLVSEKHFFKMITGQDKLPSPLKGGSSEDGISASSIIHKYNLAPSGKKRKAYKKKLVEQTLRDLQQNWDAVMLVANTLYSKKKLSYSNLKTLLTTKSNNKKFWKQKFKTIDSIFDNIDDLDEDRLKVILSI